MNVSAAVVSASLGFVARTELVSPSSVLRLLSPRSRRWVKREGCCDLSGKRGWQAGWWCSLLGGADTDGTVPSDPGGEQGKSHLFRGKWGFIRYQVLSQSYVKLSENRHEDWNSSFIQSPKVYYLPVIRVTFTFFKGFCYMRRQTSRHLLEDTNTAYYYI